MEHAKTSSKTTESSTNSQQANTSIGRPAVQMTPPAYGVGFADQPMRQPDLVQAKGGVTSTEQIHQRARDGIQGTGQPLPYLDAIQRSFGRYDISHVQAHLDGRAAAANKAIGSHAYTVGSHVAFGQAPSLHTAAHEAAHVVQQAGGLRLMDGIGRPGDRHERHADAVAERVMQGESAEGLFDTYSSMRHGSVEERGNESAAGEHGVQMTWKSLGKAIYKRKKPGWGIFYGEYEKTDEYDVWTSNDVEEWRHKLQVADGKAISMELVFLMVAATEGKVSKEFVYTTSETSGRLGVNINEYPYSFDLAGVQIPDDGDCVALVGALLSTNVDLADNIFEGKKFSRYLTGPVLARFIEKFGVQGAAKLTESIGDFSTNFSVLKELGAQLEGTRDMYHQAGSDWAGQSMEIDPVTAMCLSGLALATRGLEEHIDSYASGENRLRSAYHKIYNGGMIISAVLSGMHALQKAKLELATKAFDAMMAGVDSLTRISKFITPVLQYGLTEALKPEDTEQRRLNWEYRFARQVEKLYDELENDHPNIDVEAQSLIGEFRDGTRAGVSL